MPEYTIAVADAHAVALQKLVNRFNADNDALLDVGGFLELHAREIAIQQDLAEAHSSLVKQAEADVAQALAATKARLLAGTAAAGEGA